MNTGQSKVYLLMSIVKRSKLRKEKYKIESKRSKGASGCVTELSSVLRVIESLKKR